MAVRSASARRGLPAAGSARPPPRASGAGGAGQWCGRAWGLGLPGTGRAGRRRVLPAARGLPPGDGSGTEAPLPRLRPRGAQCRPPTSRRPSSTQTPRECLTRGAGPLRVPGSCAALFVLRQKSELPQARPSSPIRRGNSIMRLTGTGACPKGSLTIYFTGIKRKEDETQHCNVARSWVTDNKR